MYVDLNYNMYLLLDLRWNIAVIQDNLLIKDNDVLETAPHDPTDSVPPLVAFTLTLMYLH